MKHRITQYIIIIAIISAISGAYFYFQSNAAQKINSSKVNNLTSGLVGYWTFDGADMTATEALDMAGSNDGTLAGSPARTIGKVGQALRFNSSSDYLNLGDPATLDMGTHDYSLFSWIKTSNTSHNNLILDKKGGDANSGFDFKTISTGKLRTYLKDAASAQIVIDSNQSVNDGNWHLVGFVADRDGNGVIYIDGIVDKTQDITSAQASMDNTYNLYISYPDTVFFDGSLDEVRVYSRALSQSEITELYQQGQTKINASQVNKLTSGLVGYWTMDGNNISGTSLADSSGSGNAGTINGAVPAIGKIGQALNFTATATNHIAITDGGSSTLDLTGPMTISTWVKLDSLSLRSRAWIMAKSGNFHFLLDDNYECDASGDDNKYEIMAIYGDNNPICSNLDVVDKTNKWYHIAMTYASGAYQFYVDGSSAGSQSMTPTITPNDNSVFIGGQTATCGAWGCFPGQIDEVRVYSRALTQSEITELYQQGQAKINASQAGKLTNGLVGHWTFDGADMTATTATDMAGNNDGTLAGSPTRTIGKIGQGLNFNGSSDYVDAGDPVDGSLDFGTSTPFTVSAWIKTSSTNDLTILSKSDSTAGYFIQYINNNQFRVSVYDQDVDTPCTIRALTSPTYIPDNNWHKVDFVVFRNNSCVASDMQIYVDGVSKTTLAWFTNDTANANISNSANLSIGKKLFGIADPFNGLIDEVRIYSRALSQSEVTELYNMGR